MDEVTIVGGGELAQLDVFALPDFYTVMRNTGATSALYEANDFEVSDSVADERDQFHRDIERKVENDHLAVEDLYRGIMNFRPQLGTDRETLPSRARHRNLCPARFR